MHCVSASGTFRSAVLKCNEVLSPGEVPQQVPGLNSLAYSPRRNAIHQELVIHHPRAIPLPLLLLPSVPIAPHIPARGPSVCLPGLSILSPQERSQDQKTFFMGCQRPTSNNVRFYLLRGLKQHLPIRWTVCYYTVLFPKRLDLTKASSSHVEGDFYFL